MLRKSPLRSLSSLITALTAPPRSATRGWRWGAGLSLCLALMQIVGCATSFTGGSIPTGKARLRGQIITSEQPNLPLANTRVTVQATYADGQTRTLNTVTGLSGEFDFDNVPTSPYSGTVLVTAKAEDPDILSQQVTFRVANGHTATLLMALPRAAFTVLSGKSLTFNPPTATLKAGEKVQFKVQVRDATGKILPYTPTLWFNDDFGTLTPDGTFTGTGLGTGSVTAYWYNDLRQTAIVYVNLPGGVDPPPPPNPTDLPDDPGHSTK